MGIVEVKAALGMAAEKNLDLVKIAPNAVPPVCKIIDYGKYKFESAKKEKESRKNQKVISIKEIRLSLNIDTHDFETKVGHVSRFAESGNNKIKVMIRFKGREAGRSDAGYELMKRFADACSDYATVEKQPKLEGRSMIMFLIPKSKNKSQSSDSNDKNAKKQGKIEKQESTANQEPIANEEPIADDSEV